MPTLIECTASTCPLSVVGEHFKQSEKDESFLASYFLKVFFLVVVLLWFSSELCSAITMVLTVGVDGSNTSSGSN